MQKITSSAKETFNFAKAYAKKLRGGEVIGLIGELGAGKTVFTKGLAAGLGVKQTVNSPTFVLMKIYEAESYKVCKVKKLCHIDAYRIKVGRDILAIGAEEYFNRPDTVTVIEWADKIKKILPRRTRYVNVVSRDNNKKLIKY